MNKKLLSVLIGIAAGTVILYLLKKYYTLNPVTITEQVIYKNRLLTVLNASIPKGWNANRCKMTNSSSVNLECLRQQQLRDYHTEYNIIQALQKSDIRGYQELQHFTIMLADFFKSYAKIFGKDENSVLVEMMMSSDPYQGGNVGKNINDLRQILTPVTDFSQFKYGDDRPNPREFTQAILCNSKSWCKYIWLMVIGLIKGNEKVLKLIDDAGINTDNLRLRIEMIQRFMIEDIDHIIGTLCESFDINNGIPLDSCAQGNKGPSDFKCDLFCGGKKTMCTLMLKAFSFYKAMGKEIDPELQLKYATGYGSGLYKPERFQKLLVKDLLPLPSSRELKFWDGIKQHKDKNFVPWPNAMNVILTNPANPLADLSASRDDLSVAGTSGHAETILSMAILFDRYKDKTLLKDLIRGMMVSICPHHHSIREIATAAYPPPYDIDFKFDKEGPLNIVANLL